MILKALSAEPEKAFSKRFGMNKLLHGV
jgi:hypothetical protein